MTFYEMLDIKKRVGLGLSLGVAMLFAIPQASADNSRCKLALSHSSPSLQQKALLNLQKQTLEEHEYQNSIQSLASARIGKIADSMLTLLKAHGPRATSQQVRTSQPKIFETMDFLAHQNLTSLTPQRSVLQDAESRLQSRDQTSSSKVSIAEDFSKTVQQLQEGGPNSAFAPSREITMAAASLFIGKVFEVKTGDSGAYNAIRSALANLGLPMTYADLQLMGLTSSDMSRAWGLLLQQNPQHALSELIRSEEVQGLLDITFANQSQLEGSFSIANEFQVNIWRADTPEQISTLHPDIVHGLQKLNDEYNKQETNTFDVFAEQTKLKGKTIYYMVAKDASGDFAGFFAIFIGSKENPTKLARFGIVDESKLQIELGNSLVLKAGRQLMPGLYEGAVSFLAAKKTLGATPIVFWADSPVWAAGLRRKGAPQIPLPEPGVWAFGASFDKFIERFLGTANK